MKTRKQVLAEFQRMQNQMFDGTDVMVHVDTYNNGTSWTVDITRMTFKGTDIDEFDKCEWEHYCDALYSERNERRNESALEAFKQKFNLK